MRATDAVEGAVTTGVNRALHTAVDAAHHAISTPANMVVEGAKTATVFIATYVIVGGLKLGAQATWWLLTTTASAIGTVASAGTTAIYNSLFAKESRPPALEWHGDDVLYIELRKSTEDTSALLDSALSPSSRAPAPGKSVADID